MREKTTLQFLMRADKSQVLEYLQQRNLIKNRIFCSTCNTEMILKIGNKSNFGYSWRCLNYSCANYQTTKSCSDGSFFEKMKIPIKDVLIVIYYIMRNS